MAFCPSEPPIPPAHFVKRRVSYHRDVSSIPSKLVGYLSRSLVFRRERITLMSSRRKKRIIGAENNRRVIFVELTEPAQACSSGKEHEKSVLLLQHYQQNWVSITTKEVPK